LNKVGSVKIALSHLCISYVIVFPMSLYFLCHCISYVIVFPMSLWVNIDMLWWRRGVVADGARRGGTAADRTARRLSLRLHDATTEVSLHSMTQHWWNHPFALLCHSLPPAGIYVAVFLFGEEICSLSLINRKLFLFLSISPVSNLLVSKRLPLPQCAHNYRKTSHPLLRIVVKQLDYIFLSLYLRMCPYARFISSKNRRHTVATHRPAGGVAPRCFHPLVWVLYLHHRPSGRLVVQCKFCTSCRWLWFGFGGGYFCCPLYKRGPVP